MSTFSVLLSAATEIEETNLNKNEKIPEVVSAFKKCYDLNPSNEETKRKYLSYFKRQLELEHNNKNQEELKVLGNAQVQQNRYEEAVIIYDASIDLDPSIEPAAPIYSNRSLCFYHLGRFQEAEDDGCMAIFLRPEFARGYLRRGNAAMKLEKWKEASEAFEKYFELDPETAKSDPDLVKNKKLAQKFVDHAEAEIRRHERLIEKTREELMAIKDEEQRRNKATILMTDLIRNARLFDVDLARVAVESGVKLAPILLDRSKSALRQLSVDVEVGQTASLLNGLLEVRSQVPPKTLPQLDELILFIIDEMTRNNLAFCRHEVAIACSKGSTPVNPKIVRVLLETNKFDVNQSFGGIAATALISLMKGLVDVREVPSEVLDCLHLLLNWKGINVNAIWRHGKGDEMRENHVLDFVRHPEIARILIRHGANVNQVTAIKGPTNDSVRSLAGESIANVLHAVLADPGNPHLEELVQLYIRSGARLLANGKNGKSSSTLFLVIYPQKNPITKKWASVSEEVLHVILQLNQQQGLLFRWQDPDTGNDVPLLHLAISEGASARFVQILCAMHPEQMKDFMTFRQIPLPLVRIIGNRIAINHVSFQETMQVVGVLLENGFDLFGDADGMFCSNFSALWISCQMESCDLKLVKQTIDEKRGEEEFRRCAQMHLSLSQSEVIRVSQALSRL